MPLPALKAVLLNLGATFHLANLYFQIIYDSQHRKGASLGYKQDFI